ncbi:MAG TPA: branched-chain amino acid ABC transporter ATP-binding protein/permease [Beijerinckiaceae bacterium]|jgi:ABC-type branched-subunit amino acid transport system ATPase component/ABC-type branched-subunit amino acid transport system permease subunit
MRLGPLAADLGLVVAGLAYAATADSYGVFLLATVALTALAAIGLNILMGLAGQISFGHVGFMAIGAYATAILMERAGWPFFAAMPAAGLVAAAVGAVLAMPALRVRGPYLAMVTIAFGFIVEHGAVEWRDLTGGGNGLILSRGATLLGEKLGERGLAVVGVLLVGLALLAYRRLAASGWGYAMRAARDSEVAAGSVGIDLVRVRTAAFVLSAAAAALAGALFAPLNGYVSPSSFPFVQSILLVLAVLVGGAGTALGPVAGALVVVLLPELVSALAEYRLLAFGALMLAVLRLAPLGLVGAVEPWTKRLSRSREAPLSSSVGLDLAREFQRPWAGGGLTVEDLAIAFGGVRAVEGLSFTAEAGRITSLIGPNGAGKTTALNLLSGFYRPEAGRIVLDGTALVGLPSHRLARLGVARTFQTTQLFGALSPLENVMLGARAGRLGSPFAALGDRRRDRGLEELSRALLAFVGARHADGPSAALPHGEKRLVEIARALALKPRVLLLDEPAAGLALADKQRLAGTLRAVADLGVAVVLVEHDMGLVMGVSDHVVVLDAGRPIAAGLPEAVRADPAVREAYLGAGGPAPRDRAEAPRQETERPAGAPVLEAAGLCAGYGGVAVLRGVDLAVREGRPLAVLGPNGAGKTTLMRALAGLAPPAVAGDVRLAGRPVSGSPAHRRVRAGLVLVPEGRQVFPELSVRDNLRLGAFTQPGPDLDRRVAAMLDRFPRLRERLDRRAGLLSGGEQQMLAIARGLLASPKVLMLDEPSLGLAPLIVEELYASLAALRDEGLTLVVVDQMAGQALAIADEGCLIEGGVVKRSGPAGRLIDDRAVEEAYLGSAGAPETAPAEPAMRAHVGRSSSSPIESDGVLP